MKKIQYLLIISALVFVISSCSKEELAPVSETSITTDDGYIEIDDEIYQYAKVVRVFNADESIYADVRFSSNDEGTIDYHLKRYNCILEIGQSLKKQENSLVERPSPLKTVSPEQEAALNQMTKLNMEVLELSDKSITDYKISFQTNPAQISLKAYPTKYSVGHETFLYFLYCEYIPVGNDKDDWDGILFKFAKKKNVIGKWTSQDSWSYWNGTRGALFLSPLSGGRKLRGECYTNNYDNVKFRGNSDGNLGWH